MSFKKNKCRQILEPLLNKAGIQINGENPWDIQIKNDHFFKRVLSRGSLGLGESYMDGWWDVPQLDAFFYRAIREKIYDQFKPSLQAIYWYLKSRLVNRQTRIRSKIVAKQHYDLGNEFYMSFLDPYNQYTCGYFNNTNELNVAQEQKLDLICKKLHLQPEDKVLDIGCGWGGFAKFASERYGSHVTGITISDQQYKFANNFCQGLPVTILKKDYRDLRGQFDKVLVCGMIEHVGYKNYRRLMSKVHKVLHDQGLFLLHTIGGNQSLKYADPWISRYIFPNSMIPSLPQLSAALDGLFIMEDWHNFGNHYTQTLRAWYENFKTGWENFSTSYGPRFYRMWKYYLLASAGAFESRDLQLWQVVLSKNGLPSGYRSIR
jgi:cyclopropane-fatty-acyl-phospholipid synthase